MAESDLALTTKALSEQEAQRRREVWSGLAHYGGLAARLLPFVPGLYAGDPAAMYGALSFGTATMLQEVGEVLASQKKPMDFDKTGYHNVLEIAMRGSGKQRALREVWKNLLVKCLDPDYEHEFNKADFDLLDSMNPADVVTSVVITHYYTDLNKAFVEATGGIHIPSGDLTTLRTKGIRLKDIVSQGVTILGGRMSVKLSEIVWGIKQRSGFRNCGSKDEKLYLLTYLFEDRALKDINGSGQAFGPPFPDYFDLSAWIDPMPAVARLARILYDPKVGY